MMALAADKLRNLGARVDSVDLGSQQVFGGLLPHPWPSSLGGVKRSTYHSLQSPQLPGFP